jgi:hypothetical protein
VRHGDFFEGHCDNLERERHSSYLLKKNPRNRASQASLRGRNEEALKYLNEALKREITQPIDILFDPDFERMRKDEDADLKLKELLKNYPVKKEILENIRDILSNKVIYNDDYIRASFEAACDFKLKAIEILRSKPEGLEEYEKRYEDDPHFESINDLAVIVSVDKNPVHPGSNISLDLMIIKTCEAPLHNIYVIIQLPRGLILDLNYREDFSSYDFISRKLMIPLKPFPEGRWEERAVHQEILVDSPVLGKVPIKVRSCMSFIELAL